MDSDLYADPGTKAIIIMAMINPSLGSPYPHTKWMILASIDINFHSGR